MHSGLVALWRFDEVGATAPQDSSGNGYHLSQGGTVPVVAAGKFIKARGSFTDANYFFRADTAALRLQTFTVTAWVYIGLNGGGTQNWFAKIIAKDTALVGGSYHLWEIETYNSGRNIYYFRGGIAPNTWETGPTAELSVGWHFLVGTWDGVTAKFYVDGVLIDTDITAGFALTYDAQSWLIGRGDAAGMYFFSNYVDVIALYSEVKTAPWVSFMYTNTTPWVEDISPLSGSTGNDRNTNITLDVVNIDTAYSASTVILSVDGVVAYQSLASQNGFTVTPSSVQCGNRYIIDPPSSLSSTATVRIQATSDAGGSLDRTYYFYVTLPFSWVGGVGGGGFGDSINNASSNYVLSLEGTNYIPTITMLCHADKGELNHSNNPTYVQFGQTGSLTPITSSYAFREYNNLEIKNMITSSWSDPTGSFRKETYINRIGIFDENGNLIAVAKLANPVKKLEDQDFTFKLKVDV